MNSSVRKYRSAVCFCLSLYRCAVIPVHNKICFILLSLAIVPRETCRILHYCKFSVTVITIITTINNITTYSYGSGLADRNIFFLRADRNFRTFFPNAPNSRTHGADRNIYPNFGPAQIEIFFSHFPEKCKKCDALEKFGKFRGQRRVADRNFWEFFFAQGFSLGNCTKRGALYIFGPIGQRR